MSFLDILPVEIRLEKERDGAFSINFFKSTHESFFQ